jgi:hypothetical protein
MGVHITLLKYDKRLDGPVTDDLDPPHIPPIAVIVVDGDMIDAPIVPKRD